MKELKKLYYSKSSNAFSSHFKSIDNLLVHISLNPNTLEAYTPSKVTSFTENQRRTEDSTIDAT